MERSKKSEEEICRLNKERGIGLTGNIVSVKRALCRIEIKRYDKRCQQFKRNKLFRTNQTLFYETLDGKERGETELPEPMEATTCWSGILSEEVRHNYKASWLEQIEQEFSKTET